MYLSTCRRITACHLVWRTDSRQPERWACGARVRYWTVAVPHQSRPTRSGFESQHYQVLACLPPAASQSSVEQAPHCRTNGRTSAAAGSGSGAVSSSCCCSCCSGISSSESDAFEPGMLPSAVCSALAVTEAPCAPGPWARASGSAGTVSAGPSIDMSTPVRPHSPACTRCKGCATALTGVNMQGPLLPLYSEQPTGHLL